MKLIFGEQLSIDYKNAKKLEKLKVYDIHECDCEHCTMNKSICPSCDSNEEPEFLDDGLVQCVECDEKAWRDSYGKYSNKKIIKKFESDE